MGDLSTTDGAVVTLYAQWVALSGPVDTSAGEIDLMLPANQQATIEGLPSGSTYEVTETPVPEGWTLVRQRDTTGIVTPRVR